MSERGEREFRAESDALQTWSAPNGLHVLLVIEDGKVVDGLIDQRDLVRPEDDLTLPDISSP